MSTPKILIKNINCRAKINNKSELGLGYQQKLRDGVTLTLSSLVNTGTFSAVSSVYILCSWADLSEISYKNCQKYWVGGGGDPTTFLTTITLHLQYGSFS